MRAPGLCRRGDKDDLRLNLVDHDSNSCFPHKSPKSDARTQRVPRMGKKDERAGSRYVWRARVLCRSARRCGGCGERPCALRPMRSEVRRSGTGLQRGFASQPTHSGVHLASRYREQDFPYRGESELRSLTDPKNFLVLLDKIRPQLPWRDAGLFRNGMNKALANFAGACFPAKNRRATHAKLLSQLRLGKRRLV